MEVKPIDKQVAIDLITDNHYCKGKMPRITKHYLGVFDGDDLVGAITLGYGTQPKGTQRKIGIDGYNYLEIGRMCLIPEAPKNSSSQMLSALHKWAKANTDLDYIYTMADGGQGKVGYSYQAANYKYLGSYDTFIIVDDQLNPHHPKSEPVKRFRTGKKGSFWPIKEMMDEAGWSQWKVKMFRYLMPLTKRAKYHSKTLTTYPNPKDSDLLFAKSMPVGEGKRRYIETFFK